MAALLGALATAVLLRAAVAVGDAPLSFPATSSPGSALIAPTRPLHPDDGSIDGSFELLGNDIGLVHITELWNDYPWSRLFQLLKQAKYEGFCLAEIAESSDPVRLMRYYRALFLAHCAIAG